MKPIKVFLSVFFLVIAPALVLHAVNVNGYNYCPNKPG